MARLPDNIGIRFGYEISNCHWDEEAQLYCVTVDGRDFRSNHTSEQMQEVVQSRRRSAAAFEAMARCAEARENRMKAGTERLDRLRAEVMAEAGYLRTSAGGYESLGRNNPHAQRLVDIAVEARMKQEDQV
ncbi:MAG: hypothetical protein ABS888_00145 [Eubacteriales bacterium]